MLHLSAKGDIKRFDFPSLKLKEETIKDDVEALLTRIKPHWQSFTLMPISGGFSCLLYRCSSNANPDDAIAVRIIKRFGYSSLCDAKFEIQVLSQLENWGYFGSVLATFQNGYCYQYLSGHPLLDQKCLPLKINSHLLSLIASRMAQYHSMPLPVNMKPTLPFLGRLIRLVKEKNPKQLPKGVPLPSSLIEEINWLTLYLQGIGGVPVICHGDAHAGNIIWNKSSDSVYFVDWEWTHVGARASDLAFFLNFLELTAFTWGPGSLELPPHHETKFIDYYFAMWSTLEHLQSDVSSLKTQIKKYKLVAMLTVAVVQTIYQEIPAFLSHNPNEFLTELYKQYFNYKNRLLLES